MGLFSFRKAARAPAAVHGSPTVPPGQRVYAIGDVHGCADQLRALLTLIDSDDAGRRPAERTTVFLGDLVDRGPDSAGAVALVKAMVEAGAARLIKGNHEELFVLACRGDRQAARTLMDNGGLATLLSYGISEEDAAHGSYADLVRLLRARVPADDVAFLDAGENMIRLGDYLFVHAGIMPRVPLEEQDPRQLRWIRGEFLQSDEAHGVIVVHGHTIVEEVDERHNRIGIDTGAYASGMLTAIALEGEERWYLATRPRTP